MPELEDGPHAWSAHIRSLSDVRKIGHVVPSCNTALEPITAMMTNPVAERVSNHFARIPVESISLADRDTARFDTDTMVDAALSLNDAGMDAIVWNGTSGCWNGTAADVAICDAITARTGVPASTSTLAQYDAFERFGLRRFGLAVPYRDDVTARTIETYGAAGYEAVSHANLGMSSGRDMANVPLPAIRDLLRSADSRDAECIVVICTGLPAAFVVEEMEQELGKPIFDSVVVTFWKGLALAGVDRAVPGWGALLAARQPVARLAKNA